MHVTVALVFGAAILGVVVGSMLRPLHALRALLVLLPLHSGIILLLSNVWGIGGLSLTMLSAWKEAVVAGIAVASIRVVGMRWRSLRPFHWLGLALLGLVAVRAVLDVIDTPRDVVPILFGARQLGEFLVVFLAVSLLRPSVEWFMTTAKVALPVVVVCTLFAIAQPSLGSSFYDRFFHAPGETLHHAYLVNIGDVRRFRAVGTFIAPNELGLGLVVYGSVFVLPLLGVIRQWRLVAAVGMLMVVALILSFSRSAWVGAFVGVLAAALLSRVHLRRLWQTRLLFRIPVRDVAIGLGVAALGALVTFVLVGGLTLFIGTLSGSESSAAGRGDSISGGIEATFDNPTGLGLGTAGPRALELTGTAVLTENWYLLYSIQLGVLALVLLVAFAVATLVALSTDTRTYLERLQPPFDDWRLARFRGSVTLGVAVALVAGLTGGLVIPAMLDLPASIALWSSVAMVLGWSVERTREGVR